MPIPLIWGITVAFGFLAWSVFAAQCIWPAMSQTGTRRSTQADPPATRVQVYRSGSLDPRRGFSQLAATAFARGLACGDLAAATLALVAFAALACCGPCGLGQTHIRFAPQGNRVCRRRR